MSVQLVLLFLFFITASVTDIKTGKVRNKDILIFLFLGILYHAVFLARGLVAEDVATLLELKYAGINILLAFAVSFIVRSVGIWPAGDAKTYVVANLLIPLTCYKHIYFNYFPGFTLLINIFIVGIIYIIYKSAGAFLKVTILAVSPGVIKDVLKKATKQLSTEWVSYLKVFSSYLIVFFTMNFIMQLIYSRTDSLARIAPEAFAVLLFFIMRPVGGFIHRYMKGINHVELYIIFTILAFHMNGWSLEKTGVMLFNMSVNALKFMVLYGAIRTVADYYINKAQTITIDMAALKEGDLPTKEFIDSLSPETRSQLRISPEGLSAENMGLIMGELSEKRDGTGKATVYEPIPFVPIIFAGVLFTVIAGVSSVHYIKLLIFR